MTPKTTFLVTETAGKWVAGQRSPGAGKSIELTDEQARYALIAKEIRRPDPETPAEVQEDAPELPAPVQPKPRRK